MPLSEPDKLSSLTFEQALDQVEALLEKMEDGSIPLAELVKQFERGTQLIQNCQKHLQEAELRIEQLKKDKDAWQTEPLDLESP